MALLNYIEKTKKELLLEIQVQCTGLEKYEFPNAQLFASSLYEFTSRGKLLRGVFVKLVSESFSTEYDENVFKVASAIELAQSALLMHDDIMDNDDLRRGKSSMHRFFENSFDVSPQAGQSLALCFGDIVLFHLFSIIANNSKLCSLFSQELTKTAFGQAFDIQKAAQNQEITKEEIFTIIRNKTARYTFVLPFLSGGILTNQDPKTMDLLEQLAILMGYIFQIRDDELNFLSENSVGKSTGGDIRENKKTLCRYELLKEFPELTALFGHDNNVKAIQDKYKTSDTKLKIKNQLQKFHDEASTIIQTLPIQKQYTNIWLELLCYLEQRNY